MTLPKDVRYKVVERQVKNFNKENPDYYSEVEATNTTQGEGK
jgi:hypothetical protein